MKPRDEFAASIAGRDDAGELSARELEMIRADAEDGAKLLAFCEALSVLVGVMQAVRTVGDARAALARIEELERMVDA